MTNSETRHFSEYQSASDDTPLSLISALRRGSDQAWSQLAGIWGTTILKFCKRRGLKHEDCEEIVQSVLVKMYRYISRFERDGKSMRLRHWAFTIVRREIATHCERYLSKPGSPGGDEYQQILGELRVDENEGESKTDFRRELVSNVMDAVKPDFDPKTWEAFQLHKLERMGGPVIAERLGMTPNAVRQAANRVLRRIRNEMEGILEDDISKNPKTGNVSMDETRDS